MYCVVRVMCVGLRLSGGFPLSTVTLTVHSKEGDWGDTVLTVLSCMWQCTPSVYPIDGSNIVGCCTKKESHDTHTTVYFHTDLTPGCLQSRDVRQRHIHTHTHNTYARNDAYLLLVTPFSIERDIGGGYSGVRCGSTGVDVDSSRRTPRPPMVSGFGHTPFALVHIYFVFTSMVHIWIKPLILKNRKGGEIEGHGVRNPAFSRAVLKTVQKK
jgi:hypothetical protein